MIKFHSIVILFCSYTFWLIVLLRSHVIVYFGRLKLSESAHSLPVIAVTATTDERHYIARAAIFQRFHIEDESNFIWNKNRALFVQDVHTTHIVWLI